MDAAKVIAAVMVSRATRLVRTYGATPLLNNVLNWKRSISVKGEMKTSVPAIGRGLAVVMAIAKKEFVQTAAGSSLLFLIEPTPEPSERARRVGLLASEALVAKRLQPAWRDVFSGKGERWLVSQEFVQTADVPGGVEVVHHRKHHASNRITQRHRFGKTPAVNAKR